MRKKEDKLKETAKTPLPYYFEYVVIPVVLGIR